jgi:signal recognition particle receptor subunit beta
MPSKNASTKSERPEKSRYAFKITVIGPDDSLLEEVLRAFSDRVIEVDGIRISSAGHRTDSSDVKALIMSPGYSALDVMLSLTFKGAGGVVIVLREPDDETECMYRNEVKLNAGEVPTRVLAAGSKFNDKKRKEIVRLLNNMLEEMVSAREGARAPKG